MSLSSIIRIAYVRMQYVWLNRQNYPLVTFVESGAKCMRKTQTKKAHLNLSINPDILTAFDSLQPIHKREYSEFVEEKLLEFIEQLAPDVIMEMKIREVKEHLSELEDSLPTLKFAYGNLRKIKKEEASKKEEDDEQVKLERRRDDKYHANIESLKRQAKSNKFQWDTLQNLFWFKNRLETETYILGRLKEDGVEV